MCFSQEFHRDSAAGKPPDGVGERTAEKGKISGPEEKISGPEEKTISVVKCAHAEIVLRRYAGRFSAGGSQARR